MLKAHGMPQQSPRLKSATHHLLPHSSPARFWAAVSAYPLAAGLATLAASSVGAVGAHMYNASAAAPTGLRCSSTSTSPPMAQGAAIDHAGSCSQPSSHSRLPPVQAAAKGRFPALDQASPCVSHPASLRGSPSRCAQCTHPAPIRALARTRKHPVDDLAPVALLRHGGSQPPPRHPCE